MLFVLTCGDGRGHVSPLATPRRLTSFLPSPTGQRSAMPAHISWCTKSSTRASFSGIDQDTLRRLGGGLRTTGAGQLLRPFMKSIRSLIKL